MIFSPPTRRARPCAPVGNGYLCFKEMSVSFSAFYRLQLSSCGEKECLTVTHAVRFADCFRLFVSFAQETVGTAGFRRFVLHEKSMSNELKNYRNMEVVVIDKATFERMLSGFEIFAEKVERLCREQEDLGEKEWLDSDDVCRLLCISPRTLQTMRENGTLAYTKISHKVYYRPEDVKAVFPVAEMKRCITAGKERICNVTNKQTSQPTNQPTNRYLTYE